MEKITSRKNQIISRLKKLSTDAEYRRESGEFVCDGIKTLKEALAANMTVTTVLYKGETEQSENFPKGCEVYCAPDDLFDYASPLKNCPGPLFTVKMPEHFAAPVTNAVVLENLQDPGNVGTVIRTANAFGIDAVILVGDCADLYNPKTVRASMGAIFRQRVMRLNASELKALCLNAGLTLYGAALSDTAWNIGEVSLLNAAVAIGSEGRGLSKDFLNLCDGQIIIPMKPCAESLNAAIAAAVVMWEMSKL